MRKIGLCLMVVALGTGATAHATARAAERDRHMSHHEMLYGQHNHYYHHLHRSEHHHATATGGPAGGIPHRN